ncbi:putative taxadien-5-alpha-ol O-acetyltransferase [Lupinus albus]|uniref:Putative taxadien-5-alpha-ol O-acetyltransferase n=1 Tax=Lupinus albus TaxID=3870 RepID=A0A6A4NWL7_LUPAL|nr:putative taxadien-5-alpha-ol O-acetyltransferase [Lupinus albus]
MNISIIRTKQSLVKPFKNTPCITLDLSTIDKLPSLRCNAKTLHVFKHGHEAKRVIREALSKALVPYYPLAGRLIESKEEGFLQIQCSGDGAWFVEACAYDCKLESVNFFDDVESIPYDDLLPNHVPQIEGIDPLVKMQVTEFGCGGFVIGLIFCHSICDGLGAAQFLNAIGELARGFDKPTIEPVWHRHFFPSPQLLLQQPQLQQQPPTMPEYNLQHANIDIPIIQINKLKQQFQQLTGHNCSSFEIVAAGTWSSRTRAINFEHNTQVKLVFFANCRQLLEPPLPNGFYGSLPLPNKGIRLMTWCVEKQHHGSFIHHMHAAMTHDNIE